MEYCSLARAQKLLNCELEDILHWHDIGAINLCLKLNPTPGILKIAVLSHQEKEVTSAFNPFTSVEAGETLWSHHSHIRSILRLQRKGICFRALASTLSEPNGAAGGAR